MTKEQFGQSDDDLCKHKLIQVLSFHEKNFCISAECTICHAELNEKNLSYKLLDGKFGVIVSDDKKREGLTV